MWNCSVVPGQSQHSTMDSLFDEIESAIVENERVAAAKAVADKIVSRALASSVGWIVSPWHSLPEELQVEILTLAAQRELEGGSTRVRTVVNWARVSRGWWRLMADVFPRTPIDLIKPSVKDAVMPIIEKATPSNFSYQPARDSEVPQDVIFRRRYWGRGELLPVFHRIGDLREKQNASRSRRGNGSEKTRPDPHDIFGMFVDALGDLVCLRITVQGEIERRIPLGFSPIMFGIVWGRYHACLKLLQHRLIVVPYDFEAPYCVIDTIREPVMPYLPDWQCGFCRFVRETRKGWSLLCLQSANSASELVRFTSESSKAHVEREVLSTIRGFEIGFYIFSHTGTLVTLPTRGLFCVLIKPSGEKIVQLCGQKRTLPTVNHFSQLMAFNVSPEHVAIIWSTPDPNARILSVVSSRTGHVLDEGVCDVP